MASSRRSSCCVVGVALFSFLSSASSAVTPVGLLSKTKLQKSCTTCNTGEIQSANEIQEVIQHATTNYTWASIQASFQPSCKHCGSIASIPAHCQLHKPRNRLAAALKKSKNKCSPARLGCLARSVGPPQAATTVRSTVTSANPLRSETIGHAHKALPWHEAGQLR